MSKKSSLDDGILTDTVFYILSALQKEKHGYLIMQSIKTHTMEKVIIGPASLYTTLKKLYDYGYIERIDCSDPIKKTYKITPLGKETLYADIKRKEHMIEYAKKNYE